MVPGDMVVCKDVWWNVISGLQLILQVEQGGNGNDRAQGKSYVLLFPLLRWVPVDATSKVSDPWHSM